MMLLRFVRGHGRRKAARRAARAGDWRAAATAYAALARQGVATVRDRVQLGHSLKEAGDDAAADEAYRAAAAAFPHDRDALLHHGLFLQKLHRDREAIHVLTRALVMDPGNEFVREKLVDMGVTETTHDAAVLTGIMAGYDAVPRRHGPAARLILAWRLRRARRHARARRWEAAAQLYREALAHDPHDPRLLVQLGHALRERGDAAQAVAVYRHALIDRPRQPETYLHLGHALKALGRRDAAFQAYLTAARLQPGLPPAVAELNGLGWDGTDSVDDGSDRSGSAFRPLAVPDGLSRRQRSIWNRLAAQVQNRN